MPASYVLGFRFAGSIAVIGSDTTVTWSHYRK
jgi:hypothetical protein